MDLLVFLAGGVLLAALVRAWRPGLGRRAAAGYLLVTAAFFGAPLATSRLQVATDIAYVWNPWAERLSRETVPENPVLGDIPSQMVPFHALARERLLHGEAPLWAGEIGTGEPLLGNAQSAPFAPLHLMALPLPTVRGMTVAVAWEILLALLLTHALVLALGGGPYGAALAACGYAFSSFLVPWAYHPIGMAAPWIPGVLLGIALLRRGERGGFAGLVACGAGLALSGHPETMAHAGLASALAAGAWLAGRGEPGWPSRRAFASRLAGAGALVFCLAAPALLPVIEAIPASERWMVVHDNPDLVQTPRFQPRFLIPLVEPLAFGSTRDLNWEGAFNFNEICGDYAGALALAFALAGALVLRGRVARILAAGLAALLVALRIPPFFQIVTALPGFEHGVHGRMRLLWTLAVAVAAGLSLEELPRRSWKAAAAAILGAGIGLAAFPPPAAFWQRAWWIAALAGVVLALAALFGTRWRPRLPAVAVIAAVADLFLLGVRYHPALPPVFDLSPPPALAWIAGQARSSPEPFRVLAESGDLLPNLASYYGLWDPRGNDPMQPADAVLVVGRSFRPGFQVGQLVALSYPRFPRELQPAFDHLGVRYLLARHGRRLPAPWEPVFEGTGGRVWRNPQALPLFYLPRACLRVAGQEEALALTLGNRDPAGLAAVESSSASPRPASQQGAVRIVRTEANGFALDVDTPTGGLVTSTVSWSSGWRLRREGGEEEPVERADGAFVGFEVAPGRHRVELRYRPDGWVWGLQLFALGLISVLGLVWLEQRKAR
jgi:hypothetical protein